MAPRGPLAVRPTESMGRIKEFCKGRGKNERLGDGNPKWGL